MIPRTDLPVDLARETVTRWWGLFDHEFFVAHPPRFGLDRLEVVKSALADQALGFGADLRGERCFKPPFFSGTADPPASNCASHKRVLTSTNSRVRR